MNAKRARERRRNEAPSPASIPVHRTVPIEVNGKLIGHGCPCCHRILTPSGGESVAGRVQGTDVRVRAINRSHAARVKGMRGAGRRARRLRKAA